SWSWAARRARSGSRTSIRARTSNTWSGRATRLLGCTGDRSAMVSCKRIRATRAASPGPASETDRELQEPVAWTGVDPLGVAERGERGIALNEVPLVGQVQHSGRPPPALGRVREGQRGVPREVASLFDERIA